MILAALGYALPTAAMSLAIETDDPDGLRAALDRAPRDAAPNSGGVSGPWGEARRAGIAFARAPSGAPAPGDLVPLRPPAPPFGGLEFGSEACTLCLACVYACPTHALRTIPSRPMLRFTESFCVQCGLCAATCPEDVITLSRSST